MNDILQANIFFFITAVAVILVTLALIVLLIFIVAIVRDIRKISSRAQKEVDLIANDLDSARAGIKDESKKILSVWKVFGSMFSSEKKSEKSKK